MGEKKKNNVSDLDRRDYCGPEGTVEHTENPTRDSEIIIGLDISTTCTGISGVNKKDGSLIFLTPVEFEEKLDTYEKIEQIIKTIEAEKNKNKFIINSIAIEEPLKMFKADASSANTLSILQRFNGMCCYALYQNYQIKPILFNVNTLRARLGVKINKKDKTKSTKEKVREIVLSLYPDLPIETKEITRGKRKGAVVPTKSSEDCIDAFVVAKAFYLMRK